MRNRALKSLFTGLFVLFLAVSCQHDEFTVNKIDALDKSSQLTALLTSMSANDTEIDNIIDSTSCFSIKLPVEVEANGQTLTVVNNEGYKTIEGLFNLSPDDEDTVSITFPVTVVYPDYGEQVIASQEEFDALVASCNDDHEIIGSDCVTLNFPVTVYGYNSGYQMQDTYSVTSRRDLYDRLKELGSGEYYTIGYPVSLNVNQGNELVVSSNAELFDTVTATVDECETGGCSNPAILVNDILFYIPFSEGVVQDLKGNAITYPEDLGFTEDRDGNPNCAVVFNGEQSLHIPATAENGIVQGEAFSISLWFKMQNTNGADLEKLFVLGGEGNAGFEVLIYDLNTPLFAAPPEINVWDSEWNQDADLPVDTQNWHHLVITVDEQNTIKLYRDGVLRNSLGMTNANITSELMDYHIGMNFKGLMDDLRVYKRVLNPQEVQVLFELDGDCNTCLE